MAYTQADLDRLNRAIAGAELEVSYADKRVKFRSLDELIKARDLVQKELATGPARSRITRLRHGGKGL